MDPRGPRRHRHWRALDGILLLDKPRGCSSNQALQQARRLFNAAKAGHTGNLDPLADGMLPICFGEATKLSGRLLDADKSYVARARFGQRTATGDAEGEVVATSDLGVLDWGALETVRDRFLGPITQVPPMYSALKHRGRPLYELARNGETVERAARQVRIDRLEWRVVEAAVLEVQVNCSKGTYIRTLIEDLAAAIGHCAHLIALRRTAVEPFGSLPMHGFDQLERAMAERGEQGLDALLLPLSAGVLNWTQLRLDEAALDLLARGQPVTPPSAAQIGTATEIAVLDSDDRLMVLVSRHDDGRLWPRRWLGGSRTKS